MRVFILICSALFALTTVQSATFAQQKTAKACREEWQANKAENQAKGITEKAYVADCRKGNTAQPAATAARPAPPPQPTAAPSSRPAPATSTAQPNQTNEFASEAQAKARCPGTAVVWANLKSKVYHFAGTR